MWWFVAFPLVGLSAATVLAVSPAYRVIPSLLTFVVPVAAAFGFLVGVPPTIVPLARAEGLEAHAESIEVRLK